MHYSFNSLAKFQFLRLFSSGLPISVLQKAAAKSREFEATYGKHMKADSFFFQSPLDNMVSCIQELISAVEKWTSHESTKSIDIDSLTEVWHRARILEQQS